jgi:hypothetical protein
LVKLSDSPVCIRTFWNLWHTSLGSSPAARTFWLIGRLTLLLETPSKLRPSELINMYGYLAKWYLSYLVILIQLETRGRGPWCLVLTVIVTATVCRIMRLSRPTDISPFLLPIFSWATGYQAFTSHGYVMIEVSFGCIQLLVAFVRVYILLSK